MKYSNNNSNHTPSITYSEKNRGFTLIELLVVIAIIGLLSSIVLTSVSVSRVKADIAKVQTEYKTVASAIELYRQNNNGVYPDSVSYPNSADPISITVLVSDFLGPYLKQTPSVPPTVVTSPGGGLPGSILYVKNPASGVYPRFYCESASNNQDYVFHFSPTTQAIDSGAFGALILQNSADSYYTYPETDAVCIAVNQR